VALLRDNVVVDSKVVNQSSTTLTDNLTPPDGVFKYTTRQTVTGEISSQSDYLTVTVDNTAPVVIINQAPGTPDPSSGPTYDFQVAFNEPVVGMIDANHISLAGSTANVSNATITISGTPTLNIVTI